jgi:hypothetical protein
MQAIWYARYDGRSWSRPVPIYHAASIRWNVTDVSEIRTDADGALRLALTADDAQGSHVVLLKRRSAPEAAWDSDTIPAIGAIYVDLAVVSPRKLIVAYIPTAASPEDTGRNVVFLTTSHDGGRTWSAPRQVVDAENQRAFEPRILVDHTGVVHLVWRTARGRLAHAATADDGMTWSQSASVVMPGVPFGLHAVVDKCDVVHVVMESHGDRAVHPAYTRLERKGWREPMAIQQHAMGLSPSLALDAGGDLIATWGTIAADRPPARGGEAGLVRSRLSVLGCDVRRAPSPTHRALRC